MNIEVFLFYIFSSLAIICGIMVISSRNPVFSVLFLVLVFCNAAGLLLLLETDFLAMLFLIVYVGAIAVLFLFVVMMLNVRITTLKESVLRYLPIGGLILFIFFFEVGSVINGDLVPFFSSKLACFENDFLILNQDLKTTLWTNQIDPTTNVAALGEVLYTYYVYCFIVASLILLVAMIGAILLTMRKRTNVKKQEIFDQVYGNINTNVRYVN
jgi:NADH-quinone oxidoreductase subunit J|tara:strand:- start:7389 stop:8027 length:639 start_codon:yes stop_codon:yes gene_type:complete